MHVSTRASRVELSLLFAAFLLVYLFTLSDNLSAAHDSISYIEIIDEGPGARNFFHPHHLLFNSLAASWVAAWRVLGFRGDSAALVSAMNAVFGALTLTTFYRILRDRLNRDSSFSLVATALAGFSFGFWFYSGAVEVYIPPMFFLTWSLYLLTAPRVDVRTAIIAGASHGAAVLFHQVHALFLLVALTAMYRAARSASERPATTITPYLAALGPVVAVPYLTVMLVVIQVKSPADGWHWLTWFAHNPDFYAIPGVGSAFKAVVGFTRSIVGMHFAFALPEVRTLIDGALHDHYFVDEIFLVRGLPASAAYLLTALTAALALVLLGGLARRLVTFARTRPALPPVAAPVLVWLGVYTAFFSFWEPANVEFWIPQSLCVWLLGAILWSSSGIEAEKPRWAPNAWGMAAVLLLVVNFAGTVQFTRDRQNDFYYAKVNALARLATPGDLVITGREWILKDYLRRFSPARVLCLTDLYARDPKRYVLLVEEEIQKTLRLGGRVLISDEAVKLEAQTLSSMGDGFRITTQLWQDYQHRWQERVFASSTVYLLQ